MKNKLIILITTLCFFYPQITLSAPTDNFSVLSDIMTAFSNERDGSKPTIKSASDKFSQVNINSAREDFFQIITDKNISDLESIMLEEKMYELGLFNLAAISERRNNDVNLEFYINTVKNFYEPSYIPNKEEELFLAEIYSNIYYNDRSVEAIKELSEEKDLLKKSDYANYLMALGYYKTNNYKQALSSINEALDINSKCENYKFLKIKILSETGKRKEALKLFNAYNNKKELPYNYRKKCELLKQFVLYKTEKNQWERNYSLGRYYYTNGEYSKALKSLQNATLTKNKKNLSKVWGIMSRTYLKLRDDKKAKELATKAYKINPSNKDACVTLARISYKENNFKDAQEYFKKATKEDKLDTSKIMVARIYQTLGEDDKAITLYKSYLKKGKDEWEAAYRLSLLDNENKENLILDSLKYNPTNKEAWYELINTKIGNNEYIMAKQYLKNLLYIDDNDFKYYYYQGIISKKIGNKKEATKYFQKSIEINPEFYEAGKELTELKEYI